MRGKVKSEANPVAISDIAGVFKPQMNLDESTQKLSIPVSFSSM